jgi:deoxyguanosine kinase
MYLVIEGPIGVGKTSLARLLAEHLNTSTGSSTSLNLEVVEENPFLAAFYTDPARYAFNVQVFFLLSRFKQLLSLSQGNLFAQSAVSDYMFDKDFIFASMNLHDAEFELYSDLYHHLKPQLPHPDLSVYLRASPSLLFERIAKRGRSFETQIEAEYLLRLSSHYDAYFQTYSGPLLVIDAEQFDFVGNIQHRQQLIDVIIERTSKNYGGKYNNDAVKR